MLRVAGTLLLRTLLTGLVLKCGARCGGPRRTENMSRPLGEGPEWAMAGEH